MTARQIIKILILKLYQTTRRQYHSQLDSLRVKYIIKAYK